MGQTIGVLVTEHIAFGMSFLSSQSMCWRHDERIQTTQLNPSSSLFQLKRKGAPPEQEPDARSTHLLKSVRARRLNAALAVFLFTHLAF